MTLTDEEILLGDPGLSDRALLELKADRLEVAWGHYLFECRRIDPSGTPGFTQPVWGGFGIAERLTMMATLRDVPCRTFEPKPDSWGSW